MIVSKFHLHPKTRCSLLCTVMIVSKFHLNRKTRRLLKRVCHEIFDHQFFHDLNPFGSMINKLKYFRIWFRFCRDIQSQNSKNFTPQCASHSRVRLCGDVLCIILRSQTPWCASYCRVRLHDLHPATESVTYQVCALIQNFTIVIYL